MEKCPESGRVILQVFGDSPYSYEINGTKLNYGKTELPEGFYTVKSHKDENAPSFQLNLSNAGSGYILGLFKPSRNRPAYFQKKIFFFFEPLSATWNVKVTLKSLLPLL